MIHTERLGTAPLGRSELNKSANGGGGSPDIIRLPDPSTLNLEGSEGMREQPVYLVIGTLATQGDVQRLDLPEGAGIAPHEGGVFIPEEVFVAAAEAFWAQRASIAD